MQNLESYLKGGSADIFYQVWKPKSPIKGHVLISHGWNEHSACYEHFANFLNSKGWQVWVYDLRGHGKSTGERGSIDGLSSYSQDLKNILDLVSQQKNTNEKLILFAHSLGACINLLSWTKAMNQKVDALCLSSPALGLPDSIPRWRQILAQVGLKYFPELAIKHKIDLNMLVSDKKAQKNNYKDSYRHNKISPSIFKIMDTAVNQAKHSILFLNKPLLIQASGKDKVVNLKITKQIFDKIPSKSKHLKIYLNSEHEILNDIEKKQVYTDCIEFLKNLP